MRKLPWLLLAVFAVGLASPAYAQDPAKSIGVSAGVGIGYGTVPDGGTRTTEATFNGGVVAILPFSNNWAFQPEVRFDKRKITIGGISTDVTYVDVPVLLRNKFLGIYMVQGLTFNMVASASVLDVDFKSALNSPDVAIVLGAGKRFDKWSLEGRWETGLRNFQKDVDLGGVHMRALTAVVTVFLK
jgi:hypothetical protein